MRGSLPVSAMSNQYKPVLYAIYGMCDSDDTRQHCHDVSMMSEVREYILVIAHPKMAIAQGATPSSPASSFAAWERFSRLPIGSSGHGVSIVHVIPGL